MADEKVKELERRLAELRSSSHDTAFQEEVEVLNQLAKLLHRDEPNKAQGYAQEALVLAEKLDFQHGVARSHQRIGTCYQVMGNYPKALEHQLKALNIFDGLEDKKGVAVSYNHIGCIHRERSDYPRALEYHLKALDMFEEIGDKTRMAVIYNDIANIYSTQSDYEQALEYYFRALEIAEATNEDKLLVGMLYGNIGLVCSEMGEWERAFEHLFKSLRIKEELGDKRGLASSHTLLGSLYSERKKYDEALEHFLKSLELRMEINDPKGLALSYGNLGVIYKDKGAYTKALEYMQKALELFEKLGNKKGVATACNNMGEIHIGLRNYPEALGYLQRALELARETGVKRQEAFSYKCLSELHAAQGEFERALEFHKRYSEFTERLFGEENAAKIAQMQVKYETERRERETEIYRLKNVELETEIAERRRVEEALVESEGRFRLLAENLRQGLVLYNMAIGRIVYYSPVTSEILGVPEDKIENSSIEELIASLPHQDDRNKILESVATMNSLREAGSNETFEMEFRIRTPDVKTRWIEMRAYPFPHAEKMGPLSYFIFSDITERKWASEALAESEERYRTLYSNIPVGIFRSTPDGKVLSANPALVRMLGYESEQDLKEHLVTETYLSSLQREEFVERLEKNGSITHFEVQLMRRDGSVVWVSLSAKAVVDEAGEIVHYDGIVEDITERKRTQEALAESEEQYRRLVENAPVGVISCDTRGNITAVNSAMVEMLGSPSAEATMKINLFEFPPLVEAGVSAVIKRCMKSGENIVSEHPYRSRWGKEVYLRYLLTPIRDTEGRVIGCQALAEDITERKRVEQALRDSEERYRDLFENASDLIQSVTPDGWFLYVNRAWKETLGYSDEELRGLNLSDVIHHDSLPHCMELFKRVIRGEDVGNVEAVFVAKDGREIMVEGSVSCRFKDGKPFSTRGIFRDITERKRAEQLTRIQRDLARDLSAAAGLEEAMALCVDAAMRGGGMDAGGVYLVDETTGELNLVYSKGLPPAFVKAASHYDADSANARLVMAGKPVYTLHPELGVPLGKSERREDLRTIAVIPIFFEDRVIACLNVASHTFDEVPSDARDALEAVAAQMGAVIARLQTQAALAESEERYRAFTEGALVGVYIYSENRYLFVNPAMSEITGYSQEELLNMNPEELSLPEERQFLTQREEAFKRGERIPYKYAMRIRRKDGSVAVVEVRTRPIRYGGKQAVLGNCVDITELARQREQINTSLQEKEVLLKEVHHRVKNNLQVISSLLSLQAGHIEDEKIRAVFRDSQSRVASMALIHEKLYQSRDLKMDIEGISLDIDTSTSLALIVNELVSNSIKHAFPEGSHGEIRIGLHAEGEKVILSVADNGVGFPPDMDFRKSKSLGLQLVNLLVRQLRGRVELERNGGTRFDVIFKNRREEK